MIFTIQDKTYKERLEHFEVAYSYIEGREDVTEMYRYTHEVYQVQNKISPWIEICQEEIMDTSSWGKMWKSHRRNFW